MKKINIKTMIVLLVLFGAPTYVMSSTDSTANVTKTEIIHSSILLEERIKEIEEMDISSMSRTEKKTLRKEVKAINKELKENNGGIYISVGAGIIIILLLILIL